MSLYLVIRRERSIWVSNFQCNITCLDTRMFLLAIGKFDIYNIFLGLHRIIV